MFDNGKISIRQMSVLVFLATVGDSIIILPSLTAIAAKQDSWLSALLGLALGLPILLLFLWTNRMNPNGTVVELCRQLLGRWAGSAAGFLFVLYFLLASAAIIREISDFITTQMMPETPERAIHLLMLLVLLAAVRSGIEAIGRTSELFLPWYIFFLFALIVLLLPKADIVNLQPVFGEGLRPIAVGSLYVMTYPFTELLVFMMILPYVRHDKHMGKDFIAAALFGGICIVAVIMLCILVLGPYLTANQVYPTYSLAKKISIAHFLERLEALLAIVWIISSFFKCVLFFYAFSIGISQTLKLRDYRVVTRPAALLLFGLAYVLTPNISYYADSLQTKWPFLDWTFAIFIPLLLTAVYWIRRKKNAPLH